MQEDFRVDGQPVQLEDIFRDGRGEDPVRSGRRGVFVFLSLDAAGLDEMGHDVDPFLVPCQHAAPHLVRLQRLDFPPEAAVRASEDDHQFSFGWDAVRSGHHAGCFPQLDDAFPKQPGEEMDPGHVQVGEKGRVGFVEVVVAFEYRGSRRCHDGLE